MTYTQLTDLTKKNQEFIHIATTQLIKDGKTDEEIKALLEEILPTILENQKKGITARGLYGAPSEWAASHRPPVVETIERDDNDNPWLMWLDASFFAMGALGLFTGLLNLFGRGNQYGILTFFLTSFGVGAGIYFMYYTVYRHMNGHNKPKMWKSLLYLTLTTGIWSLIFILAAYVPQAINPLLPAIPSLLLGALAFLVRYLLKRKYKIRSALQPISKA